MASSEEYLDFILEQLAELEEMSYRPMMGEYILYYRGKIIGGIYDNRLLLKPVKLVMDQLGQTRLERPYEGAKEMYEVLPAPKVKKKTTDAGMSKFARFNTSRNYIVRKESTRTHQAQTGIRAQPLTYRNRSLRT